MTNLSKEVMDGTDGDLVTILNAEYAKMGLRDAPHLGLGQSYAIHRAMRAAYELGLKDGQLLKDVSP